MEWRKISGFELYEVSNTGLVRRIGKEAELAFSKQVRNFTTYYRVTLFKEGKRYYKQVHRLVAEAYVPNPNKLPRVDHIDTNGENNTPDNLDWVTASENISRSFKLNPEKLAICSKGGKQGGIYIQAKAEVKYKAMLGGRFIAFHKCGTYCKDASVEYRCECGATRTASVMWKELRNHKGVCPLCSGTEARSSKSLK